MWKVKTVSQTFLSFEKDWLDQRQTRKINQIVNVNILKTYETYILSLINFSKNQTATKVLQKNTLTILSFPLTNNVYINEININFLL